MSHPLSNQHCCPMAGKKALDNIQIQAQLVLLHPDWQHDTTQQILMRDFTFQDYYETIAFVNALAFIAHRENHHPDLSVHYNHCVVQYSTHDVGGLSNNDFICAHQADLLLES